jgi:hypothetical protein
MLPVAGRILENKGPEIFTTEFDINLKGET